MDLGRVGVWNTGFRDDSGEVRSAAAELEELGYGAIWVGGTPGVRHVVPLLEATSSIVVATAILSIWGQDPSEVAERHTELSAAHGGRFLLGLGASHASRVADYHLPYSTMVRYLDRLDAAGCGPRDRVLAALGPRMLALSRDRAAGAHPYLVTPEHTAMARKVLGQGPLLAPEVKIVLDEDPDRAIARDHLRFYLTLPNYLNNLRRLGFTDDDLADGGSDRLIDAIFVRGGIEPVRARIAAHTAAGADHVVLQVITGDRHVLPMRQWRELAAALELRA